MSRCERFERDILGRLESGLPLDGELARHLAECADCRAERSLYDRLAAAVAAVGADDRPPAGWQEAVRRRVRLDRPRTGRRRWLAAAALTAAAGLAALLLVPAALRPPAEAPTAITGAGPAGPRLEQSIVAGPEVRRGAPDAAVAVGDRLRLEATTAGARHAELRLYRRDRELVAACVDRPPCRRTADRLRADFPLGARGEYTPVLVLSEAPPPAPGDGGLDDDLAAVLAAGAAVEVGRTVRVR